MAKCLTDVQFYLSVDDQKFNDDYLGCSYGKRIKNVFQLGKENVFISSVLNLTQNVIWRYL